MLFRFAAMKVSTLLQSLPDAVRSGADAEIGGLASDSRGVQPGDVFIAYPGVGVDGRTFIAAAITRGAAAVVTEADAEELPALRAKLAGAAGVDYPVVAVPDGRAAL